MRFENIKPIPRLVLIVLVGYGIYSGVASLMGPEVDKPAKVSTATVSAPEITGKSLEAATPSATQGKEKLQSKSVVTLTKVVIPFDGGKTKFTAPEKTVLKDLRKHAANPDTIFIITGHTDDLGSQSRNRALGERRAKAVLTWLNYNLRHKLTTKRVDIRSAGDSEPLTPNTDDFSRAKNRRVDITVTTKNAGT